MKQAHTNSKEDLVSKQEQWERWRIAKLSVLIAEPGIAEERIAMLTEKRDRITESLRKRGVAVVGNVATGDTQRAYSAARPEQPKLAPLAERQPKPQRRSRAKAAA